MGTSVERVMKQDKPVCKSGRKLCFKAGLVFLHDTDFHSDRMLPYDTATTA